MGRDGVTLGSATLLKQEPTATNLMNTAFRGPVGRVDVKDDRLPKIQHGRARASFEQSRAILQGLYSSPHQGAVIAMAAAAASAKHAAVQTWDAGLHDILRGFDVAQGHSAKQVTKEQTQHPLQLSGAPAQGSYLSASFRASIDDGPVLLLASSLQRGVHLGLSHAPTSPYIVGANGVRSRTSKSMPIVAQGPRSPAQRKSGRQDAVMRLLGPQLDVGLASALAASYQPQHGPHAHILSAVHFSTAAGTHRKYNSQQVGHVSPHFSSTTGRAAASSKGALGDAAVGVSSVAAPQRTYPPFASVYMPTSKPLATSYSPVLRRKAVPLGVGAGQSTDSRLYQSAPFPSGMGGSSGSPVNSPAQRHPAGSVGLSLNIFTRPSPLTVGLSPRSPPAATTASDTTLTSVSVSHVAAATPILPQTTPHRQVAAPHAEVLPAAMGKLPALLLAAVAGGPPSAQLSPAPATNWDDSLDYAADVASPFLPKTSSVVAGRAEDRAAWAHTAARALSVSPQGPLLVTAAPLHDSGVAGGSSTVELKDERRREVLQSRHVDGARVVSGIEAGGHGPVEMLQLESTVQLEEALDAVLDTIVQEMAVKSTPVKKTFFMHQASASSELPQLRPQEILPPPLLPPDAGLPPLLVTLLSPQPSPGALQPTTPVAVSPMRTPMYDRRAPSPSPGLPARHLTPAHLSGGSTVHRGSAERSPLIVEVTVSRHAAVIAARLPLKHVADAAGQVVATAVVAPPPVIEAVVTRSGAATNSAPACPAMPTAAEPTDMTASECDLTAAEAAAVVVVPTAARARPASASAVHVFMALSAAAAGVATSDTAPDAPAVPSTPCAEAPAAGHAPPQAVPAPSPAAPARAAAAAGAAAGKGASPLPLCAGDGRQQHAAPRAAVTVQMKSAAAAAALTAGPQPSQVASCLAGADEAAAGSGATHSTTAEAPGPSAANAVQADSGQSAPAGAVLPGPLGHGDGTDQPASSRCPAEDAAARSPPVTPVQGSNRPQPAPSAVPDAAPTPSASKTAMAADCQAEAVELPFVTQLQLDLSKDAAPSSAVRPLSSSAAQPILDTAYGLTEPLAACFLSAVEPSSSAQVGQALVSQKAPRGMDLVQPPLERACGEVVLTALSATAIDGSVYTSAVADVKLAAGGAPGVPENATAEPAAATAAAAAADVHPRRSGDASSLQAEDSNGIKPQSVDGSSRRATASEVENECAPAALPPRTGGLSVPHSEQVEAHHPEEADPTSASVVDRDGEDSLYVDDPFSPSSQLHLVVEWSDEAACMNVANDPPGAAHPDTENGATSGRTGSIPPAAFTLLPPATSLGVDSESQLQAQKSEPPVRSLSRAAAAGSSRCAGSSSGRSSASSDASNLTPGRLAYHPRSAPAVLTVPYTPQHAGASGDGSAKWVGSGAGGWQHTIRAQLGLAPTSRVGPVDDDAPDVDYSQHQYDAVKALLPRPLALPSPNDTQGADGMRLLGRKYEVQHVVGEGAYGLVMKCHVRGTTGQFVAIKEFKIEEEDPDADDVKRTSRREAALLRSLQHPNVVEFIDEFLVHDQLYIVMEFVPCNLLELLEAQPGGMDREAVRLIMFQLCTAIAYIHGKDVVYRDIKPENLLVDEHGRLKLCDFGFARFITGLNGGASHHPSQADPLTDYVATRWYRAPELLLGPPYSAPDGSYVQAMYGPPIDMWAIGCLMGELVDGDPLFAGDSDLDQLYKIQQILGPINPGHQAAFDTNPHNAGIVFNIKESVTLARRYEGKLQPVELDFLAALLCMDPGQRMTGAQCLQHPYLADLWQADQTRRMSTGSAPSREQNNNNTNSGASSTQASTVGSRRQSARPLPARLGSSMPGQRQQVTHGSAAVPHLLGPSALAPEQEEAAANSCEPGCKLEAAAGTD